MNKNTIKSIERPYKMAKHFAKKKKKKKKSFWYKTSSVNAQYIYSVYEKYQASVKAVARVNFLVYALSSSIKK